MIPLRRGINSTTRAARRGRHNGITGQVLCSVGAAPVLTSSSNMAKRDPISWRVSLMEFPCFCVARFIELLETCSACLPSGRSQTATKKKRKNHDEVGCFAASRQFTCLQMNPVRIILESLDVDEPDAKARALSCFRVRSTAALADASYEILHAASLTDKECAQVFMWASRREAAAHKHARSAYLYNL